MIIEWSWESEEFLVDWNVLNVPILKKDEKEDPGSYRSVSLPSVTGKIMEKIILGVTEKH